MRVTNNMLSYNFLASLNKSMERQNAIQEQLSDGKAIHRPSDDPIKTLRALRFDSNLSSNEQYQENLSDAQSWMQNTDDAVTNVNTIMLRLKELTVAAANGTNSADELQAMGSEVDGLINQLVNIGNTKLGDRYLFAGQKDKTQPFERSGDLISYNGDANKISMVTQPGTAAPSRDAVNMTGEELFGKGGAILSRLIDVKNHMLSGTAGDQQWLSETGLANLDDDNAVILQAQTTLGARAASYEWAQEVLEKANLTITGDLAGAEDLDIPKAIIDFKTSEAVYRNALNVGARIMPTSLVDFMQ